MRKLPFVLFLTASVLAQAQEPTPSPTPTPVIKVAGQPRPVIIAQQVANQINALTKVADLINDGVPADGNRAAVTGKEIQTALGTANMAKISAVMTAIGRPVKK